MFVLMAWTLLTCIFGLLTVVCAVLCLFAKGKTRDKAIDLLLMLASATLVLTISGNFIPKEWYAKESTSAMDIVQLDFHRQADMCSAGLRKAELCERMPSWLKFFTSFDGYKSKEEVRTGAKAFIEDLADKHPKDSALAARLAVLTAASNGDSDAIFKRYYEKNGSKNELMTVLNQAYSKSNSIELDKAVSVIQTKFPDGWFQDEALKSILDKSSVIVKSIEKSREVALNSWIQRYSIFQILRILFAALGIFAIIKFFSTKPDEQRPDIPSYGFRKAYGCLLAVFCSQAMISMVLGLAIGIYIGISKTLSGTLPPVGNLSSLMNTSISAMTAISALTSLYFFVCRPAKMSLWHDFWLRSQKIQLNKMLPTVLLGFCAMVLVNVLVRLLAFLFPGGPANPSDLQLQLVDAALSGNILWVLAWSVLYCVIAPLSEEMLFRGLLYPWLRQRWGIAWGIFISSAAFAAFHMNLTTFPQHLLMGVIFGLLYERTRSLPTVALLHATWNLWILFTVAILVPS